MSTRITRIALSTMAAIAMTVSSAAAHAQNIGLPGADFLTSEFGKPNTATYGQTFTVQPGATALQSFSFWLSNNAELTTNPASLRFKGYVMAWNAVAGHATGPALYTSAVQNGPTLSSQRYDFATGGIALNANAQYVAFLSASPLFASIPPATSTAAMETTLSGTYAGGQFVYTNNGTDFGQLTTTTWDLSSNFPEYQAHFEARFAGAVTTVPEPSSLALFAVGGLAMLVVANKRKRA
jgi:hypothetical protein